MLSYYVTSATGWLMIVLLIVVIIYPFLLRSGMLGPVQPFLHRMRFHYWLGYGIVALVIIHAWIPMSSRLAGAANALGLDLATLAFLLVFLQVMLGLNLSSPKLAARRLLRRWHFWVMIGIAGFVLAHIALNSPTIQLLVVR